MIQFTSIENVSPGQWLFTWADTGAEYYRVVLNGNLIAANVITNSYLATIPGYTNFPPHIEVVSETELATTEAHPLSMILQWYSVAGAADYLVQQKIGGNWVNRTTLVVSSNWVYTAITPFLDDDSLAEFRVRARSLIGDLSAPLEFNKHIVRIPNPPAATEIVIDYSDADVAVVIREP